MRPDPPSGTDRRARTAVLVGFAVQGLTFASLLTRLPAFKDRFDLTDVDILLTVLAVAGASAVGSLLAGQLAARVGSAAALRLTLAGASLTVVLPSLVGSFELFVAAAASYGLFVGAVDASLNMQGVAVQVRYGRSIMSGFHAMWSLAAALGAGYAALSAGLDLSLGASLALVGAAGLLLNLLWCRHLLTIAQDPLESPRHDSAEERAPGDPASDSASWRPVAMLAIPTFVMWLCDGATSTWSGIYLDDGLGAAAALVPAGYGAYQLLVFAFRLAGDALVERYGTTRLLTVLGWVAVAGLVLVVAAPAAWVAVLGFAALGAGLAVVPPLSMVAAARLRPDAADQAVARINVANYAGFIVAAVGIAAVSEGLGPRAMFVVPLLAIAALPLMARRFSPAPLTCRMES